MNIAVDILILKICFIIQIESTLFITLEQSVKIEVFAFIDIDDVLIGHAADKRGNLGINGQCTVIRDRSVIGSAIVSEREAAFFSDLIGGSGLIFHSGRSRSVDGHTTVVLTGEDGITAVDSDVTFRLVGDSQRGVIAIDVDITVIVSGSDGETVSIDIDSSAVINFCGTSGSVFTEGQSTCVGIAAGTCNSLIEDQLTVISDLDTAAVGKGAIDSHSSVINDLHGRTGCQREVVVGTENNILSFSSVSFIGSIGNVFKGGGSTGFHIAADHQ